MQFCGRGKLRTLTLEKPASAIMRRAVWAPQTVPSPAPPSASEIVMQCIVLMPQ
jgi:hypothetical protein